ncbi:MAG TPA: dihydrofolate reductase [Solirubrobacteraceae bacterium]
MPVSLVVAHSRNNCIGRGGELPWRLPSDLRRFREITMGGTVVMGRRTFESIPPAFRPLPGRRNLVLSRDPGYVVEGAEVFSDLDAALAACGRDCFVIGGAAVFAEALPIADRIYATLVDSEVEGDTFMPALREDEWRCVAAEGPLLEDGHAITFRTLIRHQEPLYDEGAAREEDQRERMRRLDAAGVCVFCPPHAREEQPDPPARSGEHWYVTRNRYPYPGTAAHYLIIPHRHVTAFDELPDAAGAELWAMRRWLKERLAPLATATVERSGDMRLNGGSIAHLHTHFVALGADPEQTVRFRVSRRVD